MFKNAYMQEYEKNYQANMNEKNAHIDEVKKHIEEKEEDIKEKEEKYEAIKEKTFRLLKHKYDLYLQRIAFF